MCLMMSVIYLSFTNKFREITVSGLRPLLKGAVTLSINGASPTGFKINSMNFLLLEASKYFFNLKLNPQFQTNTTCRRITHILYTRYQFLLLKTKLLWVEVWYFTESIHIASDQ